jgi:hypothetical protein
MKPLGHVNDRWCIEAKPPEPRTDGFRRFFGCEGWEVEEFLRPCSASTHLRGKKIGMNDARLCM